jgi:hypothetical protein
MQPRSEQVGMSFRKDVCDDHVVPRPATGETPGRNIRVGNRLWHAAQEKAKAEGRTLTDVIVAYLRRYVSTPPRKRSNNGAQEDGR